MTQSGTTSRRGRPARISTIGLRYPFPLAQKIRVVAKARSQSVSDYVWGIIEDKVKSDARKVASALRTQTLAARKQAVRDESDADLVYIGLQYPWQRAQVIRVVAVGIDIKVPDYIRDLIEDQVELDAKNLGNQLQGEDEES